MSAHFLLSSRARSLTLASVMRMTDEEVARVFIRLRWANNKGEPYCPHCGCTTVWVFRRPGRAPRGRCKACQRDFSVTSGTLFAFHKMPLRAYLAAIAIFCNEVKGKSMLALSRDLGVSYKAAFVLAHKMREAMGAELKGRMIGGKGETAAIDGAYFGGYQKPANLKDHRKDRRTLRNQNGKRKVV